MKSQAKKLLEEINRIDEDLPVNMVGQKDEHIFKSTVNNLYGLLSNFDSNPPHLSVYRNESLIGKIPLTNNEPSLNQIESLSGNLSESDRKEIHEFMIHDCHSGLPTWEVAYSMWDIVH